MYNDFKKTIYNIASRSLNANEFVLQLSDSNTYEVDILKWN